MLSGCSSGSTEAMARYRTLPTRRGIFLGIMIVYERVLINEEEKKLCGWGGERKKIENYL